jgi:phosphatidylinositol-3-phosphatase
MGEQRRCETCGVPLDADQRYCLTCGSRATERSPLLGVLLSRIGRSASAAADRPPAPGAADPVPAPQAPAASPRGLWAGLQTVRLPGPWVSALLVALFVGFGALLGDTGAGAGGTRLAASAQPLKVVVPAAPKSAAGGSESTGGTSGAGAEPPESESESTPAPEPEGNEQAATGATPAKAKKKKKAKAGKPAKAVKHTLAQIGHVFVIVLSDEPYAADFGPETKVPYLAHSLEQKGELLMRYDAIAHEQLPNGIALLSGQGPSAQTAADCPTFSALSPGTAGSDEQALGDGCVYPAAVKTLPGQLVEKHLAWRAYVQGIDEGGATPPACAHPATGAPDASTAAESGAYATYRNPFVYFQSIASTPSCAADDVGLSSLKSDLSGSAKSTPAFSYIVPDRCHDAGPSPCSAGAAAGPADAEGLLREVVGEIMASKAYKSDGLIVITADEAPSSGEFGDSSSCCGQPAYPNLTTSGLRHGGGVVGALLLSPLVKGGTTSQEPYNHYSLLRTVEDVFGLTHIGYAALPAVTSFSTSLLNAAAKG